MLARNMRRKLYEYVVDEVGLAIVRGDYAPGETLPNEDTLCETLDVSRGVLREAMKVLTQKGLIESRPRTGTTVCPRSSWNLFDPGVLTWKSQAGNTREFLENIMEVRLLIESEAAKRAAERATKEDIDHIRAIYDDMADVIRHGPGYSDEEFMLIDVKFHTAILEACGNELLAQIGHTMRQALLTAWHSDRHDLESQKNTLPPHLAILNAIANRDPATAYRASQEHIRKVWHDIQQKFIEKET